MVNRPYLDMSVDYKAELGIYVLNPLKQPTGCSDTIDMLWWKSAGVDFELAVPMPQMKIPAWDATSITSVDPQSLNLQAQSGFVDKDRNVYHLVPGQDGHGRLMQAVCTIGERVESLRSLTKRFGKIAQYEEGVTTYPTTASVVMSPRDAVLNLYPSFMEAFVIRHHCSKGMNLSCGMLLLRIRTNLSKWKIPNHGVKTSQSRETLIISLNMKFPFIRARVCAPLVFRKQLTNQLLPITQCFQDTPTRKRVF